MQTRRKIVDLGYSRHERLRKSYQIMILAQRKKGVISRCGEQNFVKLRNCPVLDGNRVFAAVIQPPTSVGIIQI